MAIKKHEIHLGLQRYQSTRWEFPLTEEEQAELRREMDEISSDATLRNYEEIARQVLTEAGLPDRLGAYLVDHDGSWSEIPQGWRAKGLPKPLPGKTHRIASLTGLVQERPLTPEWRAAKILFFADGVRRKIAEGDAENAVWHALHLQEHVTTLALTEAWEPHAVRGLKTLGSSSKGGRAKANAERVDIIDRHSNWQNEAIRIWRGNPRLSKSSVAAMIAINIRNGKSNTIRQVIKKPDRLPATASV